MALTIAPCLVSWAALWVFVISSQLSKLLAMLLCALIPENYNVLIQIVSTEQAPGGRYCISQHFAYKGEHKIRNAKYPMTQKLKLTLSVADTISSLGKRDGWKYTEGNRKSLR